jgi:hypothetical protein
MKSSKIKMAHDVPASSHVHSIRTEKIFTEQTRFKHFYTEAPCVEYVNTQQNLHLFGEDKKADGTKQFYAINRATIYTLSKLKKFHLYEYYGNEQKLKLFLDIDIKPENIPETADKQILFDNYINDSIKLIVNKLEEDHGILNPQIIILKSSSDVKLSAHVIFCDVVFRNIREMKVFITEIKSPLIDKGILDKNVYRKGAFRCMWNSKCGKNINLEFYKGIRYEQQDEKKIFYDTLLTCINLNYHTVDIVIPANTEFETQKNTKKNKNKNSQMKKVNGINVDVNDTDIKHPVATLKMYLDILDVKRADAYDTWLKVGMILYGCNPSPECFYLWDEWSKTCGSDNYMDQNYNMYKWNSFKNTNCSIGSLKYLAKLDSPDIYPVIETSTGNPIFDSLDFESPYLLGDEKESIKENASFVSPHIIDWMENKNVKTLAIRSCYNSGKTDIIKKIIKEFNPKKVLFISYRQTLTHELFGNFRCLDFRSYFEGNYGADRFICQIESLQKIMPHVSFDGKTFLQCFDLIILDEVESILNHFISSTIDDKLKTFKIMSAFIHNASKILALDGDFFNRAYSYLESFGKIKVLKNTIHKDLRNYIFTNNRYDVENNIEQDLKNGKNLVIVSMSSKLATFLYNVYKDTYKCILHTKHSNDKDKKKLQNVKKYWKEVQLVLYSPSIESGVNFDEEHFYKIYMILSSKSTSQRGLLQMGSRVRQLEDKNIMVYLNNLPYREKCNFYTYDEAKAYVLELDNNLRKPDLKLDKETNKNIYTYEFDNYTNLTIYNQLEQANKTSNIFVAYLIKMLKEKGHTYEHRDVRYKSYAFKKDTLLKDEILNGKNINDSVYNDLVAKLYSNEATKEDKIMIEKHKMKIDFKTNDITSTFLDHFLGKTHVLYNLRWMLNEDSARKHFKANYFDLTVKLEQIAMIREVILKLGFVFPVDVEKVLDRDTFIKNIDKVLNECQLFVNIHKSQPLFEFDKIKIAQLKKNIDIKEANEKKMIKETEEKEKIKEAEDKNAIQDVKHEAKIVDVEDKEKIENGNVKKTKEKKIEEGKSKVKAFMGFINTLLEEWGLHIKQNRKYSHITVDKKRQTIPICKYTLTYVNGIDNYI